jgi:hypothetical protein
MIRLLISCSDKHRQGHYSAHLTDGAAQERMAMAVGLDTAALVAAAPLHREWGSLDMGGRGSHLAQRHRRSVTTDMRGNAGISWLLRRPHTRGVRGVRAAGLDSNGAIEAREREDAKVLQERRLRVGEQAPGTTPCLAGLDPVLSAL